MDWEGVQHYVPKKLKHLVDFSAAADPREAYKRLCSLAQNRVYFPDSLRTNRVSDADLKDAYALSCLYLAQDKFVSFDDNQDVRDFLLSYLKNFNRATHVGELLVLENLLSYYQFPEHYKTFRKYVARTIRALEAQDYSDGISGPDVEPSVRQAAKQTGTEPRTLYDRIKKGRLPVVLGERQIILPKEGQEVLWEWATKLRERKERVEIDRVLARAWLAKKGIAPGKKDKMDNAMRQIRRWRKDGTGNEEIADEKIGRKWVEQAVRSLSEGAEGT